jgi:hypothetical protein
MADYVIRNGQKIEVETLPGPAPRKQKKCSFEYQWIEVPRHWVTALINTKSVCTYRLALFVLIEEFKRRHVGGEIVLSAKTVPWMHHSNRLRSAWELSELGLIKIRMEGRKATVVSWVNLLDRKEK